MNEEELNINEEQDFENDEQEEEIVEETIEESQEDSEEVITMTKSEWESKQEEIRKEQDKRWKERTMKAIKSDKVLKETPSSDDAILARLENRGVMDKDDQDYVLKFAKVEGINPVEALENTIVQDRISQNKRIREQKAAAQPIVNRTGASKVDEVSKWVSKFKKDGSLPNNNPALTSKILDALRNE